MPDGNVEIPKGQWFEIADWFSRVDELLEANLKALNMLIDLLGNTQLPRYIPESTQPVYQIIQEDGFAQIPVPLPVKVIKETVSPDYGFVTVTTRPTLVRPANSNRNAIQLVNTSNSTVYIGFSSDVTDRTGGRPGIPLFPGGSQTIEYVKSDVYAVVSTGEADLGWLEV